MLDFGVLPPEVNSAMMYAGPGSGPMMAAASAWSGLAAELSSATASYQLATSRLTESWLGPASTSMAAAAAPYVAWMSHTAAQAQQTATQAAAAAAAYEAAFAATVPPPVIAANRTQLMSLVATNFLGQNTPAITATEAAYAEMWAQDAAAMYGYAASSSAATTLTPFNEPTQGTSPTGQSAQAAAVTQAVGTSSATNSQTTLSQVMSAVPQQLQSLSAAGSSGAPTASAASLISSTGDLNTLSGPTSFASATFRSVTSAMSGFSGVYRSGLQSGGGIAKAIAGAANGAANAVSTGSVRSAVLASVGKAVPIGELSVPSSWAAATPAISPAAAPQWLPSTNLAAVPAMAENEPGMMGGAPMAGMGQMTGMLRPRTVSSILRIAPRRFVMPRPAVGG